MKYRPEIDGIRALAVVPVILFHAGFEAFSGGYIGVDVFFVISGYLITRLIADDLSRGEFTLAGFYERRARRILPALFVVCAVCLPIGWHVLVPDEFSGLGLSVAAVAAFVSNFHFWSKGDYFAAPAETFPLHHTWSLAVEEQFYALFPLMLLGLSRRGNRRTLGALLLVSLASLLLAEVGSRLYPAATFYLLPTRAWELGVGAIAALNPRWFEARSEARRNWLAAAGLSAILTPMVAFDADTRHPSLLTLIPVLGTVVLIVNATRGTVVGRGLSSRPMVAIGLVSYSAYLWHQPLFAFTRLYSGTLSPDQYAGLIAATFALAALSWRFVERPFRDRSRLARRAVWRFSWIGGTALIAAGLVAHTMVLDTSRLDAERQFIVHWARDRNPTYRACLFRSGDRRELSDACIHGSAGHPKVAIVGDSHAAAIAGQLAVKLNESGKALVELTRVACPPALGLDVSTEKGIGCADFNATVAEWLETNDVDSVVMFARWSQYLHSRPYDNGEGVSTGWNAVATPVDGYGGMPDDDARVKEVSRRYVAAVTRLLNAGKKVVLVYPLPEIGWDTPREMARRRRLAIGRPDIVAVRYSVYVERNASVFAAFDSIPSGPNLVRVFPADLFCNSVLPGRCVAELNGQPLYWDGSHLNHTIGAKLLAEQISRAVEDQ